MEIGPVLVAVLASLMFVASVLNGIAGFGFALVAVAGMAVVLEPKPAIVIMSLITPVLTAMQLHHHWAYRGVARRLPTLLLGASVGASVGTLLLVILPGSVLAIGLGLFTLWFAADSLRHKTRSIASDTERRIAPGVGLLAGLTNGSLGASGPVLGSYLIAIGLRGRDFVFAISLVFATMSAVRVVNLTIADEYTTSILLLGIGLTVPAFVGQWTGFRLQGRLSPVGFQHAIVVTLLVASAYLLYSGIADTIHAAMA